MTSESTLVPFPIAAAQSLTDHEAREFAFYLPVLAGEEPVPLRGNTAGPPLASLDALAANGVRVLLVDRESLGRLEHFFESRLEDVLRKPDIKPQEKARVVRHVGTSIAKTIATETPTAQTIQRADEFVGTILENLLADQLIATHLLDMTDHHRSTASHMFSVSMLAIALGSRMFGNDAQKLKDLSLAGLLHDLGKLQIRREILDASHRLSTVERETIQNHPIESVRLIGAYPQISPKVCQIILQHHERLDGHGYPLGLTERDLLPESKVLTVVDCYHALITRRSYHEGISTDQALSKMSRGIGTQFCPDVMKHWVELLSAHAGRDLREHLQPAADPENAAPPAMRARETQVGRKPRQIIERERLAACAYKAPLTRSDPHIQEFSSVLRDVSCGGLCMQTSHPMYRGETLDIRFGPDHKTIWVCARVAWCRKDRMQQGYRVGVQFMHRLRPRQITDRDGRQLHAIRWRAGASSRANCPPHLAIL